MSKEEILTSVYNMIYEQNTTDKKECLSLAEEITEFIEKLIDNQSNKNKDDRSMVKLIESNKRFDEKIKPKKDDRDSYEGGFDSSMWLSTI